MSWPVEPDVYFTREYHALHEAPGVTPVCFAHDNLVVPGLRTAIPGTDLADLQTCNGYGGPLGSGGWDEWRSQARRENIIAALFRLHPLLDQTLPPDAEIRTERETVYLDLTNGVPLGESRHRNMVQRARREGAQVLWGPAGWNEFIALYRAAMDRLSASDALRFSDEYFTRLRGFAPAELATLSDDRGVAAAAVMMWGPQWAHYHLAARRSDAPNYAASFVLQCAVERAVERGLAGVHLGGGTTNAPDDSLLRFKRSLGGISKTFRVARVIANRERFAELVAARGGTPTWLLGYRQPC